MSETLTQDEIKRIMAASRLMVNRPGHFYKCKVCKSTFPNPDFYYSQSRLMMATCPNCGRPIKGV